MVDWLSRLHWAAEFESEQDVAALVAQADDVDAMDEERTALWRAVHAGLPENVRVLLAAGADPTLPMMYGWSPARLSLATGHPVASEEVLTPEELAAVWANSRRSRAEPRPPKGADHRTPPAYSARMRTLSSRRSAICGRLRRPRVVHRSPSEGLTGCFRR